MDNLPNSDFSELNAPIDIGIQDMLQHQAYVVQNEQINFAVKIIELASLCNDPKLDRIIKDANFLINDTRNLIKYFSLAGMNPYPDNRWDDPKSMLKIYNIDFKELFRRLNESTRDDIINKGIDLCQ